MDEIQRKIRVAAARRRIAASTGSGDGERNGFEVKKELTVPAAARRHIAAASVKEEKYSAAHRIRGGGDGDDDDATGPVHSLNIERKYFEQLKINASALIVPSSIKLGSAAAFSSTNARNKFILRL